MGNKKIKSPITKGVAKVPVIMQMEALECGAACLAMISAYYGKWIPLERVRLDCGVSRDGSNAKNVLLPDSTPLLKFETILYKGYPRPLKFSEDYHLQT